LLRRLLRLLLLLLLLLYNLLLVLAHVGGYWGHGKLLLNNYV
jgi:hypothetical protein